MKILSPVTDNLDITTRQFVLSQSSSVSKDYVDAKSVQLNLRSIALDLAEMYGYYNVVVDSFSDSTEITLSGSTYNSTDKYVSGAGTVLSSSEQFTSINALGFVRIFAIESLGTGSITYEFSKNNGTNYVEIQKNANNFLVLYTGNTAILKATISGDAKLYGWVYMVK